MTTGLHVQDCPEVGLFKLAYSAQLEVPGFGRKGRHADACSDDSDWRYVSSAFRRADVI